nr:VOC family protein [Micromonospora tarapacensis]
MTGPTRLALTTVNLDTPDPAALARFYARLLAWTIEVEEADDVILRAPTAGSGCPSSGSGRTCARPGPPSPAGSR